MLGAVLDGGKGGFRWTRSKPGRAPKPSCSTNCRCGSITTPMSSRTTKRTADFSKTCSASRWSRRGASAPTAPISAARSISATRFSVSRMKARLTAAGEPFRETDHGYCKSIYTRSPDGMILEFTCDPPDVTEIDALRKADAHSELKRWLAGDRRVNNQLRHRED